jgi:hypothetical protein
VSSHLCGACTAFEFNRPGSRRGIGEAGAASELELSGDGRVSDDGAGP